MESNKQNIKDYKEVVKKNKPTPNKSHLYMSFIVGGIICMIGQFINNFFSRRGFSMLEAANMTSIAMVFLGSLLTGLGLYDNIGKKAGAGSIVPITGFANSIVSSAMEFQKEGYIFGMAANMFKIAGPVIVFGVTSSSVVGLIYFILTR
ncbi:stage V sporulation protein AC [Anaerofustis stercorihominis]|uniref:Stage V sporulation protein AC n=2 Tax=Anaerofustis stercorihominis TaxID=214853 RepID=B1C7V8_9FIRM|nr:stage V sporulation protein AC [Anaerofustis stercorihominis]EDS73095.1 stage V sporulation protein AC [Anaerofustis stercorihominis DSM 17244]MCQ4794406.1 stage V sporulation protein AC [Anaerofustis stercorihominis]RGD74365.1 stage V sporulation protein AC [Anaerofustis stercorihominis]